MEGILQDWKNTDIIDSCSKIYSNILAIRKRKLEYI